MFFVDLSSPNLRSNIYLQCNNPGGSYLHLK
jgi:serine/threonine protein kinase